MEFINKFLTFVFLRKIVVKIVIEKLKFSSISSYEIFVRGEYFDAWLIISKLSKLSFDSEKTLLEIFLQYCSCFSTKIENDLFHGWILVDKLSPSFFVLRAIGDFSFFIKAPEGPHFVRFSLSLLLLLSFFSLLLFLFFSFFFLYTRSNSSLVRNSLETLENGRSIIQNTF